MDIAHAFDRKTPDGAGGTTSKPRPLGRRIREGRTA